MKLLFLQKVSRNDNKAYYFHRSFHSVPTRVKIITNHFLQMRRAASLIEKLHLNVNGMSELNMKCWMKSEGKIKNIVLSLYSVICIPGSIPWITFTLLQGQIWSGFEM